MKVLDKVYIHPTPHLGLLEATEIPVNAPNEQEYIRKETLLEWLNDVENVYNKETDGNSVADGNYYIGMCEAFEMVANKLNKM